MSKEYPKHLKSWAEGDKIKFYYLPKEHRVQHAEPPHYKEFIELVPKAYVDETIDKAINEIYRIDSGNGWQKGMVNKDIVMELLEELKQLDHEHRND